MSSHELKWTQPISKSQDLNVHVPTLRATYVVWLFNMAISIFLDFNIPGSPQIYWIGTIGHGMQVSVSKKHKPAHKCFWRMNESSKEPSFVEPTIIRYRWSYWQLTLNVDQSDILKCYSAGDHNNREILQGNQAHKKLSPYWWPEFYYQCQICWKPMSQFQSWTKTGQLDDNQTKMW